MPAAATSDAHSTHLGAGWGGQIRLTDDLDRANHNAMYALRVQSNKRVASRRGSLPRLLGSGR